MTQLLIGGGSIVDLAIERIRTFEPPEGYYLAFSGGKDSVVLKWLTDKSGVKYDAHYRICPDPPELQRFIIREHPEVQRDRPEITMWRGIVKFGFPIRQKPWCCAKMKEAGGDGRLVLTGIRIAESARRKQRHGITTHFKNANCVKTLINPIFDWQETDVWDCIRHANIAYCGLYDEGWRRLGCVLCPKNRKIERQIQRWSKIAAAYRRAFRRLYERHPTLKNNWSSADILFETWLDRDAPLHGDLNQPDDCELFTGAGIE